MRLNAIAEERGEPRSKDATRVRVKEKRKTSGSPAESQFGNCLLFDDLNAEGLDSGVIVVVYYCISDSYHRTRSQLIILGIYYDFVFQIT